ncbi:phosphopantetheine-binding protein [Aquirufa ecclesiirivi]|uniref:phosphopantetheine-binding protein n=1 Tax=Aquirufa ecclesiirivi TaxID=2715124 RepID=UPI0023D85187|nr:phosphopantetheine-binding protein [Aquirufa ecclesiirivi]MDF0692452.1 phosphopantetheine-binding protein [Aquirufa ecclesiirivi]
MEYKNWLIAQIASEASIVEEEVDCDVTFDQFNLDSLAIVSISFEMESQFQLENVDPSLFSEYNTINKLCVWLENQQ